MWFAILAFGLGGLLAMSAAYFAKNIEKAIETEYWARDEALNKVRIWMLVEIWLGIVIAMVPLCVIVNNHQKTIDELKERVEKLETVQVDTVYTAPADTINIKDVIYDTIGGENSK